MTPYISFLEGAAGWNGRFGSCFGEILDSRNKTHKFLGVNFGLWVQKLSLFGTLGCGFHLGVLCSSFGVLVRKDYSWRRLSLSSQIRELPKVPKNGDSGGNNVAKYVLTNCE